MLGKDNEALEALEKSDGLLKDAPIQQARNASLAGVIHFRKGADAAQVFGLSSEGPGAVRRPRQEGGRASVDHVAGEAQLRFMFMQTGQVPARAPGV